MVLDCGSKGCWFKASRGSHISVEAKCYRPVCCTMLEPSWSESLHSYAEVPVVGNSRIPARSRAPDKGCETRRRFLNRIIIVINYSAYLSTLPIFPRDLRFLSTPPYYRSIAINFLIPSKENKFTMDSCSKIFSGIEEPQDLVHETIASTN